MEFTTFATKHEDLAEALKGVWGKDVYKDCSLVYCGQLIIGIAEDTEILDKNVKCSHYSWEKIGDNVYLSILK